MTPYTDRQERTLDPHHDDRHSNVDTFELAYVTPGGARVFYNRNTTPLTREAVADAVRCELLARAQGRDDAPEPEPTTDDGIWSRTPTPAQVDALARAMNAFVANLSMWSDEAMPTIAVRWLREEDDPVMRRAWGFCRWVRPGHVQIALRVDASPERIFSTVLHEAAHAADHELLRRGAPSALLEERARHIQRVLGED
jgi:hypothetical protein